MFLGVCFSKRYLPPAYRDKGAEEQGDYYVQKGKALLLSCWKRGNGYVIPLMPRGAPQLTREGISLHLGMTCWVSTKARGGTELCRGCIMWRESVEVSKASKRHETSASIRPRIG